MPRGVRKVHVCPAYESDVPLAVATGALSTVSSRPQPPILQRDHEPEPRRTLGHSACGNPIEAVGARAELLLGRRRLYRLAIARHHARIARSQPRLAGGNGVFRPARAKALRPRTRRHEGEHDEHEPVESTKAWWSRHDLLLRLPDGYTAPRNDTGRCKVPTHRGQSGTATELQALKPSEHDADDDRNVLRGVLAER
jgi:hypothetical protein